VRTGVNSSQGHLFAIDNFFRDVALRAARIEHIEFRSEIPFHNMGPVLSNFLSSLPLLRSVKLSDSLLSSDVVTALAKCPDLEAVRITDPGTSSEQESADLENFMPVLEDGAFPSIKVMHFKAHLWNATRFLQPAFPASRLRCLAIRTLKYESYENISGFFGVVAEACPNIESLALNVDSRVGDQEYEPIPFAALEPLLQCGSLAQFSLTAPSPLDLDDTQAALIALHWPRMQNLHLNSCPISPLGTNRLTFMTLSSFAMHCPSLQHLEICVQPGVIPPLEARTRFRKLITFTFSVSENCYDIEELALFLSDVLPSTCRVTGNTEYLLGSGGHHLGRAHVRRCQLMLEKVLGLLPILRKVHAQYHERLRTLEGKVHRLRLAVDSMVKS